MGLVWRLLLLWIGAMVLLLAVSRMRYIFGDSHWTWKHWRQEVCGFGKAFEVTWTVGLFLWGLYGAFWLIYWAFGDYLKNGI